MVVEEQKLPVLNQQVTEILEQEEILMSTDINVDLQKLECGKCTKQETREYFRYTHYPMPVDKMKW